MPSKSSGLAQDRVQSFLWNTTKQGTTFVPGQGGNQGRAGRVERSIQAVDQQFANPPVTQHQGQGPHHGGRNVDLNGVGRQFDGYTHHRKSPVNLT